MRRIILGALAATGMFLAIRRMAESAGPAIGERCSEMCDRMLAIMPESFPPNRMMADIDSLKETVDRILEVLEERQP